MIPQLNAVKCDLLRMVCININNNDLECSFEIDTTQFTIGKLEKLLTILTSGFRHKDLSIMFYFDEDDKYCDIINISSKSLEDDMDSSGVCDIDILIRKFKLLSIRKSYDVWCINHVYKIYCKLDQIISLINVFNKK